MAPQGLIKVVNADNDVFVGTSGANADMCIFTSFNTQKIHIGTDSNGIPALVIARSNVELKGRLTKNGITIIDDSGNLVGADPSLLLSGGSMTGQIRGYTQDSAATPAYSWSNDASTGIFRKAAGTIGFSTAGTESAVLSSAGLSLSNVSASNARVPTVTASNITTSNITSRGLRLSN